MKVLTRKQVEGRQAQAVRFTRDVVGDADRAAEIESESVEHYATRRKFQIENPRRKFGMARKSVAALEAQIAELQDDIEELEEDNEQLQNELDAVADIVSPEEEEGDEDEEDEDDSAGE